LPLLLPPHPFPPLSPLHSSSLPPLLRFFPFLHPLLLFPVSSFSIYNSTFSFSPFYLFLNLFFLLLLFFCTSSNTSLSASLPTSKSLPFLPYLFLPSSSFLFHLLLLLFLFMVILILFLRFLFLFPLFIFYHLLFPLLFILLLLFFLLLLFLFLHLLFHLLLFPLFFRSSFFSFIFSSFFLLFMMLSLHFLFTFYSSSPLSNLPSLLHCSNLLPPSLRLSPSLNYSLPRANPSHLPCLILNFSSSSFLLLLLPSYIFHPLLAFLLLLFLPISLSP
jgi:hypothetical protein